MRRKAKFQLVSLLAREAACAPFAVGPIGFFRRLISISNVPDAFKMQAVGALKGDPEGDAVWLVDWALNKRTNPLLPGVATLVSILEPLIFGNELGLESQHLLAAIVISQNLLDSKFVGGRTGLDRLKIQFMIPGVPLADAFQSPSGPQFEWRGPDDALLLQSYLRHTPPMHDLGFLKMAISRASSVCCIELFGTRATGFLISPQCFLTCFHVICCDGVLPEPAQLASECRVGFGFERSADGAISIGKWLSLSSSPLIAASPQNDLDFALLQLSTSATNIPGVGVAPLEHGPIKRGDGINLIQHPLGGPMQMSLSADGVTNVNKEGGRLQYLNAAAPRSSGAPCFDANWKVVAIHQAERSTAFGTIRQGVLMSNIVKTIDM